MLYSALPDFTIHTTGADKVITNGYHRVHAVGVTRISVTDVTPLPPVKYLQRSITITANHLTTTLQQYSTSYNNTTARPTTHKTYPTTTHHRTTGLQHTTPKNNLQDYNTICKLD